MKWSPPHIEHRRWLNERLPLMLAALSGLSSGCSTLPVMQSPAAAIGESVQSAADSSNAAAENARMTGLPPVPVFDVPVETAKTEVSKPPAPVTGFPKPVPDSPKSTTDLPKSITDAPKAVADVLKPVADGSKPVAGTPTKESAGAEPPIVAKTKPAGILVSPPTPFSWERTAGSSGKRPFLTATIGEDGYRTLVVGSIGGHDPLALELVDQLTRHLHEDSVIIGGFESTIIRTLNPDGEANRTFLNQKEQYINHGFPRTGEKVADDQPVEVRFLLEQLQQLQPQRVLHIRTVQGENGVIAASASCQTAAKEAADWLKFKLVALPEKAVAGSMERYIAVKGSSDMITLAIPDTSRKEELWERYGDTLLNLLLGDDLATREIARKQAQPSSADRRNQNPGK